ncbi:hypothetical protein M885DRAFT_511992 [Pelagophyceae sp. CCMP2097]|nr:hypothetical protein M885DRAFT_511992 [Pelagophyceae sp. CCMP2097]
MVPECAPTSPLGVSAPSEPGALDVDADGGARNSRTAPSGAARSRATASQDEMGRLWSVTL